jgi:serine phosphatase RsbU (regulator of sigma subunit)
MPSRPFRLAIVLACAFAVSAPVQAKKDPLSGSGYQSQSQSQSQSNSSSQSDDSGKKSPYTDSSGVTTVTTTTPAPGTSPQNGNGSGNSNGVKKRASTTTDKNKKSPYASGPSGSSATVTTTTTTSSSTAAPVSSTPVASTPVKQRKSSSGSKKHRSSRHKASHRSASSSSGSGAAARRTVIPAASPVASGKSQHKAAKHSPAKKGTSSQPTSVVTRTVHDIVKVIPGPLKMALAGMAGLLLAALAGWTTVTLRARRLKRQRRELLAEVGLLQAALLPEVPERVGPVAASVAYRPADGPAAGGDFYDFFEMEDGRIGIVLGDVAGHGRDALARTALLRYTLRAYLETGLEPRTALRLGGETLDHNLASFATAAVAIYDPTAATLTYSCAGHPPPIMLGPAGGKPITVCSSPPIGVGERTGDRQTTVVMPAGSIACFFTDGLAEARISGDLLGRGRLVELLRELGPEPTAPELIERVRRDVHHTPDDMAACIVRPVVTPADAKPSRVEELELREGGEADLRKFLDACGVAAAEIDSLVRDSNARAEDYGGAIVRVKLAEGEYPQVSVVLPMIELLASARR